MQTRWAAKFFGKISDYVWYPSSWNRQQVKASLVNRHGFSSAVQVQKAKSQKEGPNDIRTTAWRKPNPRRFGKRTAKRTNPLARAIPARLIPDGKGGYRVFVNAKRAGIKTRNGKRGEAVDARSILRRAGIDPREDFHALRSGQVDRLLAEADAVGYRKPKNASGSRARYFHAYLIRRLN